MKYFALTQHAVRNDYNNRVGFFFDFFVLAHITVAVVGNQKTTPRRKLSGTAHGGFGAAFKLVAECRLRVRDTSHRV